MGIELTLTEAKGLLCSLGICLSTKQLAISLLVFLLISLGLVERAIKVLGWLAQTIAKLVRRLGQDEATAHYVRLRGQFASHLLHEIRRLNQEANWNDFLYTELDAEVEIEFEPSVYRKGARRAIVWLNATHALIRNALNLSPTTCQVSNLIDAVRRSSSRSFLLIGDPGSGKTVALRHLALQMANECVCSSDSSAVLPIYLNLKALNIPVQQISADAIRDWVIEQLCAGQDRLVQGFLDRYFDDMLENGRLFFLCDSFDEIPGVLEAQEDSGVVDKYALALHRFIDGLHTSKGLVSSRPYRAPNLYIGQRMVLRPFSLPRIFRALSTYLQERPQLARTLWRQILSERDDLLQVIGNPFYLSLLAYYCRDLRTLPQRKFDLFEHFMHRRIREDAQRLRSFGLQPEEAIESASLLAYVMTNSSDGGLEIVTDSIPIIILQTCQATSLSLPDPDVLIEALTFSKLARSTTENLNEPARFSFVHRRFQEYLAARFLSDHPDAVSTWQLTHQSRWREVLVLLCEVLPILQLSDILLVAQDALMKGVSALPGTLEHRQAVQTLRWLRDGFRSRLNELPSDIRHLCGSFFKMQFEVVSLLSVESE